MQYSNTSPTQPSITLGEKLVIRLHTWGWPDVQAWLERCHSDVLERINRLVLIEEDYRLDRLKKSIPPENYKKIGLSGLGPISVYRGTINAGEIRPGDWIALKKSYAVEHAKGRDEFGNPYLAQLKMVEQKDIYWSGTDENEFFYLPEAWRKATSSAEEYLRQLSNDQIRILCDGELSMIHRHKYEIKNVERLAISCFKEDRSGFFHGPDHWGRVRIHAHATARSLGVDPLVPHIFAFVHDSQREDDGIDPDHGRRAAAFIASEVEAFSFLRSDKRQALELACERHSDGEVSKDPLIQSCWDADRLDLGRVGVVPRPEFMGSGYAKNERNIAVAIQMTDELSIEERQNSTWLREKIRA